MLDVEGALTATAGKAFRSTRFYAETYESEPADASEIPYISDSDYHRAAGLLDCVVDREAIIGILPPYYRDASRFPFTVPEDEAELVLRQRRIVRAMKDLGVDFSAFPRFLIVADGRRGPFACELAKGFYWEGFQTSISLSERIGRRATAGRRRARTRLRRAGERPTPAPRDPAARDTRSGSSSTAATLRLTGPSILRCSTRTASISSGRGRLAEPGTIATPSNCSSRWTRPPSSHTSASCSSRVSRSSVTASAGGCRRPTPPRRMPPDGPVSSS